MAYTDIDKPSDYFNTKLYTGNGGTQSISGLDFAPDWVWIKDRDGGVAFHRLVDNVRGATKLLYSNGTNAEDTDATSLTSFNSDGFTLSSGGGVNASATNFASWNWKANGTGVANTDGTISSTVSANTTAGFSIVTFTGTTSNQSVGHGLGVTPVLFIVKSRSSGNWWVYTTIIDGSLDFLSLNTTNAAGNASQDASTSTVFYQNQSNASVAYCFADVKGYSKFGSYKGNGNADGTFVYTGFKPAMIIAKQSSGGQSWQIHDTARDTFNLATRVLFPNNSSAEQNSSANGALDILSNGFKWRMADADQNGSGSTYIYMAFAENPFVTSTGVPATAR
jgi:hypothetical protein